MKRFALMAIFAGLLIGIGGTVYLRVGGPVGAIMFAFGLLSVVMCGAQLYTGKSGFLPYREWPKLILMILLNAVGCLIAAFMAKYVSNDTVATNLSGILNARSAASWHSLLVTSAGTGMIMTLAVYGARKKHYLPLLFGVPVFILCGLPHCVADAFYFLCVPIAFIKAHFWAVIGLYICLVLGNLVGCNLYRIVLQKDQY
jgi:formate/nitrite transporter FocA (FNT family)